MNKTLKICLALFTGICFVVLVVFCVELILQNRGVERAVPQTPAFADVQADDSENNEFGQNEDHEPYEPDPPEDSPPAPAPAPAVLERHEFEMPTGAFKLVMYVDMNNFEYDYFDVADWFTYLGEGATAFLEIHRVLISEEENNPAVSFMADRFEVEAVPDERYFQDETYRYISISDSDLSGIYAIADLDGTIFETWILAIPYTENLGAAITISYRDNTQLSALEAILSTMELLLIDDSDAEPDE